MKSTRRSLMINLECWSTGATQDQCYQCTLNWSARVTCLPNKVMSVSIRQNIKFLISPTTCDVYLIVNNFLYYVSFQQIDENCVCSVSSASTCFLDPVANSARKTPKHYSNDAWVLKSIRVCLRVKVWWCFGFNEWHNRSDRETSWSLLTLPPVLVSKSCLIAHDLIEPWCCWGDI